jgi:hypothetical protein
MKSRYSPLAVAVSLVVFALALAVSPALADGVYHSQHVALAPVDDFPLRSGFVENIHANGPKIYAHENYVLNGAAPNTTYDVFLLAHIDPLCEIPILALNTASLTTNVAGNGKAQVVLSPEQVPPPTTLYLRWELRSAGVPVYRTECSMVVLD